MPSSPRDRSLRLEFDREASTYDRTASASMPGYSELHRALLNGVPFLPTRSFHLLELGVGTGTLSTQLLRRFPHARLTGVDLSRRMIAKAREKLRPLRDRVQLRAGDLGEFPPGEYDAVVSALAIHHLPDRAKWALFRRIRRTIPVGGYFGDADDHLPEDSMFDNRYAQIIAGALGARRGRGGGNILQEVWHEHERFDHPCTVGAEMSQLERAGFAHVGNPWRYYGQAVIWAYR